MDDDAQNLLELIKADQRRTSDRQHRDARRMATLRTASLMLGTGYTAVQVSAWLMQQHLTLEGRVVELARRVGMRFDKYGRERDPR